MKKKKVATVIDVARAAGCSSHVVRTLADLNLIDCSRDYNNWRRFPNLDQSIKQLREIIKLEKNYEQKKESY